MRVFLAALIVACSAAASAETEEFCLHAESVSSSATAGCSDDPLGIADRPEVVRAREGLGLAGLRLSFRGCEQGRFETMPRGAGASPTSYRITYPINADLSAADYVAPITHELAHVFQMQTYGGLNGLVAAYPERQRIELGADFLAGVAFRNYIHEGDRGRFQHNLNLIGRYYEDASDAHGTPEQRTGAFRTGYFVRYDELQRNVRAAHDLFQSDYYYTLPDF